MPYIFANNVRTQRLSGSYQPANFPLPIDSLQAAMRAPAAAASVIKAASARRGMRHRAAPAGVSGAYTPNLWTTPPYRAGMSGAGMGQSSITDWLSAPNSFITSQSNLIVYGAAVAAYLLLSGGKRRR